MGFEVTKISKSAAAVEFVDMWGDRIAVQHEPGANLEVSWSNRDMRNIILNRDLAATAGRILLAYARDGDLSGAEAAIAGTDAKPADADPDRFDAIEWRLKVMESLANVASNAASRMDDIERRLSESEDAQAQQAGWLGGHRHRLEALESNVNGAMGQLGQIGKFSSEYRDRIATVEGRIEAVEERLAEAADGTVKVPVTVVKTWPPKVGDRVIDKGLGLGCLSCVGEGVVEYIDSGFGDGRLRYVVNGNGQRWCLLEHLEPAPPRDRTPQEIADEMTARFPVGTKVSYRLLGSPLRRHDGEILGSFFACPAGDIPAVPMTDGYRIFVACDVQARD